MKRKKEEEVNEAEEEERCVSIISSLLNNLARGSRRDRVCAKFVENEFEKCDHIMELYTRYTGRVRAEEVCHPPLLSCQQLSHMHLGLIDRLHQVRLQPVSDEGCNN